MLSLLEIFGKGIQPLTLPLFNTRSAHEVLEIFLGNPGADGHDIVRSSWQRQRPGGDFERFWKESLNAGVVEGTAATARAVTFSGVRLAGAAQGQLGGVF